MQAIALHGNSSPHFASLPYPHKLLEGRWKYDKIIDELSILAERTKVPSVQKTRKEILFRYTHVTYVTNYVKVLLTSNKWLRRRQSSPEGKNASPRQKQQR